MGYDEGGRSENDYHEKVAALEAKLAEAHDLLRLVIPNCEWLHHEKKNQHHGISECPVERRLAQYDFDPDGRIAARESEEGT